MTGAEVVAIIVETVTDFLEGIGAGIVALFRSLMIETVGQVDSISVLGVWVLVLLGIAIGLGAVAWVSTLIRNRR